jgi:hypothetical protein
MTTALTTRADLDQLRCEEPFCDEVNPGVVLFPVCHPDALSIPLYHEGELHLECAECGKACSGGVPVSG